MSDGITVDLGSALPYLVESVLGWFNHDAESVDWKRTIEHLVKLSTTQAAFVQCVGMSTPVPITKIYQTTRLLHPWKEKELIDVDMVLQAKENFVIFAGPGWGKTTLLHWLYMQLCQQRSRVVPVLFTLRWPNARQDLEEFVGGLERRGSKNLPAGSKLILLVDGYDEVSEEDRKLVSKALMLFQSLRAGSFYLTCRSFYSVYELRAEYCNIAPFTDEDSKAFIRAFSEIYGVKLAPEALMTELIEHGFLDFAQHPLMLTLVCILKSSANSDIPRRAIGLIRRAIDTLTLRWDEQKGVHRQTEIPLDGEERVRCLMRVAFGMTELQASDDKVEELARDHVRLLQIKGVDVRKLLDELARWYGILVPLDEGYWTFAHRSIHDYLAARFWVESHGFASGPVGQWTTRAAYATCLIVDATQNLCRMLANEREIAYFTECLYNQAPFSVQEVTLAVLKRMERMEKMKELTLERTSTFVSAKTKEDFYFFASEEFLREIAVVGLRRGGLGGQVAGLYALAELSRRKLVLSSVTLFQEFKTLYPDIAGAGYPVQVERKGAAYSYKLAYVVVPQQDCA